jgi:hypothetical protein
MAALSVQELIGEVAKRHNVLLGPHDPILVTLTLNELIVAGYVDRINVALADTLDQLSGAQAQHIEAAREIASGIITRAADYGADQIRIAVDELAAGLRASLAVDVAAAQEAASQAKQARIGAIWALVAAFALVALAMGLILGKVLL